MECNNRIKSIKAMRAATLDSSCDPHSFLMPPAKGAWRFGTRGAPEREPAREGGPPISKFRHWIVYHTVSRPTTLAYQTSGSTVILI